VSPSSTSNFKRYLSGLSVFFWGFLVVIAAEVSLRALDGARVFRRPIKTGLIYMDAKRDAFEHAFLPSAKNPGILILGSSVADTNLDPTILADNIKTATGKEYDIFNGALYGTRLSDNAFFLDWYYKKWKFEKVIFNVDPGVLRPGRMPFLQEKLDTYWIDLWLRDHSALFRYRDQLAWYKPEDNEATVNFDAETTSQGWNRTLVMPLAVPVEEQIVNTVAPFDMWEIETDKLNEIAQWCVDHDVEMIWTVMPYREDVQQAFKGKWSFENVAAITRTVAEAHGQKFVDVSALTFPKEDFFDPGHFNSRGALKMSNIMGNRLGELLKNGESAFVEPARRVGDESLPQRRGNQVFREEAAAVPAP
jgi:hypothetical protein